MCVHHEAWHTHKFLLLLLLFVFPDKRRQIFTNVGEREGQVQRGCQGTALQEFAPVSSLGSISLTVVHINRNPRGCTFSRRDFELYPNKVKPQTTRDEYGTKCMDLTWSRTRVHEKLFITFWEVKIICHFSHPIDFS